MDLGLEPPTKMTAKEHSLQRQSNTKYLFFVGVKPDADDNPTLVLPIHPSKGELIHTAGSKASQNSAYTEGIDGPRQLSTAAQLTSSAAPPTSTLEASQTYR